MNNINKVINLYLNALRYNNSETMHSELRHVNSEPLKANA